jgi:hypothetical protein
VLGSFFTCAAPTGAGCTGTRARAWYSIGLGTLSASDPFNSAASGYAPFTSAATNQFNGEGDCQRWLPRGRGAARRGTGGECGARAPAADPAAPVPGARLQPHPGSCQHLPPSTPLRTPAAGRPAPPALASPSPRAPRSPPTLPPTSALPPAGRARSWSLGCLRTTAPLRRWPLMCRVPRSCPLAVGWQGGRGALVACGSAPARQDAGRRFHTASLFPPPPLAAPLRRHQLHALGHHHRRHQRRARDVQRAGQTPAGGRVKLQGANQGARGAEQRRASPAAGLLCPLHRDEPGCP